MISRRFLVAMSAMFLAPGSRAQGIGSVFVGAWQGQVQGVGDVRLIVTGIKTDGQVEGRMEFTLQSFVSTFGDKVDMSRNINYGLVSGTDLRIESALGGKYELRRDGDRLSGSYTRGTTYNVAVSFTRR